MLRDRQQSRRDPTRLHDFTIFLWLLKLGALVRLYFLVKTLVPPGNTVDLHLVVPAQILFAVSAFRCLFPNQYKANVVFHETPLCSIFLTRLLATFAEVALIYQLSDVLRLLNVDRLGWAILVAANAVASAGLYPNRDALGDRGIFIYVNLLFGLVYLSWQVAPT